MSIYGRLRRDILPPLRTGERLPLDALAERYHVGLTPLREALNRLRRGVGLREGKRGFRRRAGQSRRFGRPRDDAVLGRGRGAAPVLAKETRLGKRGRRGASPAAARRPSARSVIAVDPNGAPAPRLPHEPHRCERSAAHQRLLRDLVDRYDGTCISG